MGSLLNKVYYITQCGKRKTFSACPLSIRYLKVKTGQDFSRQIVAEGSVSLKIESVHGRTPLSRFLKLHNSLNSQSPKRNFR